MSEKVLAALEQAVAAATALRDSPFVTEGQLVAVQIPIREWVALSEAIRDDAARYRGET